MKFLRPVLVALLVAASTALPSEVQAQTRADTAAVLLRAARDLQAEGRGDAARAVLDLIRRQYGDTPAAASAAPLLTSYVNRPESEPSGRVELLVWGTTYGLWAGVATPILMSAEDESAYGLGLLAGAPLGFLAARSYTKAHPNVSIGQARAITFGGTWGTWQGFGWMQVLGGTEVKCGPDCSYEEDPDAEHIVGAMLAGGLIGIGTGAMLARKPIPAGVAATVSSSGLWGTWFGTALGVMADLNDDDGDLLAGTLLAGNATVAAAGLLAPRWNPSVNRVRLVSLSGLVGGAIGGGLVLIIQPQDERTGIGIPLAGSIIGLASGARMTRDYDRDRARTDGGNGDGALLRYDNGQWQAGAALPTPVLRPDMRGAKPRLQPALALQLFSARF